MNFNTFDEFMAHCNRVAERYRNGSLSAAQYREFLKRNGFNPEQIKEEIAYQNNLIKNPHLPVSVSIQIDNQKPKEAK